MMYDRNKLLANLTNIIWYFMLMHHDDDDDNDDAHGFAMFKFNNNNPTQALTHYYEQNK